MQKQENYTGKSRFAYSNDYNTKPEFLLKNIPVFIMNMDSLNKVIPDYWP